MEGQKNSRIIGWKDLSKPEMSEKQRKIQKREKVQKV
jgi:hypothetical protein